MNAFCSFGLSDERDDTLIARKVAMLHEVLKRELPVRLPGVSFTIEEPHMLVTTPVGDRLIVVDVTCEWGDPTDASSSDGHQE